MNARAPFRSGRWQTFVCAMVLAGCAVVAYSPALTGGFIWDDDSLVTRNALVKAGDGLYRMWFTTEPIDYQHIAIIAVVSGAAAGLVHLGRLAQGAVCAGVLPALGSATWRENQQYANAEVLYRTALEANPTAWLVHNNLGGLLLDRSENEEAAAHFREALRIKPDLTEAHNNLCYASMRIGRMNDAAVECTEALKLDPNSSTAHNGLGEALAALGRLAPARAELESALRVNAGYADAHAGLGFVLARQGKAQESVAEYVEALRIDPALAKVHDRLGSALEDRADPSRRRSTFVKPSG